MCRETEDETKGENEGRNKNWKNDGFVFSRRKKWKRWSFLFMEININVGKCVFAEMSNSRERNMNEISKEGGGNLWD